MKSLFVSICGAPNVGKSTLVNYLVGQKVTIVSPKVQTTRDVIRGIWTENDTQIVFLDTPGIFKPKRDLEKTIVKNAHTGIRDGQLVCLVIDGTVGIEKNTSFILHEFKAKNRKIIVIVNKIDKLKDDKLITMLNTIFDPEIMMEIFPISAQTGQGIDNLKKYLLNNAQEDVWYYDEDDVTDRDFKFATSEITREKLFLALQEELPYNLCVVTDEIVNEGNFMSVSQTVYVHKKTQKSIVIGKKGSMIAGVIKEAIVDMQELFEKPTKINIFVKVKENWMSVKSL